MNRKVGRKRVKRFRATDTPEHLVRDVVKGIMESVS